MSSLRRLLPRVFVSSFFLAASGCATVEVWERGNLAKPHMAAETHALQNAARAHTYGSREAGMAGGQAGAGGGCGCY